MTTKVIGIIDYGSSNLLSVFHSINAVGATPIICQHPEDLYKADKIIFPGVGSFNQCISALSAKGFTQALDELVIKQGKFILGICLGMQVMAKASHEGGYHQGLGWFDAEVVKLIPTEQKLRVPHVGWNQVDYQNDCRLFTGLSSGIMDFYFVHSYHMKFNNPQEVVGISDYGQKITAAIWRDNIYAVQFHPEKSQDAGLKILDNFINLDL
jgi:glutamine amidotransferase